MARILIVDDEDVVRSLLRTVLRHDGHEVVEAADGREAIELYSEQPADLVIVDLIMPKINGVDTVLKLREIDPNAKFIVMTGALPSLLGPNLCNLTGEVRSLAKPMSPTELLEATHEVLAGESADV